MVSPPFAHAQDQRRSADVSITQFVPASAGVYVHVSHLGEVNEALHRANVWRILPMLISKEESDPLPGDLYEAVAQMLGSATIRPHELIHAEIGLAAASLDRLSQAILFVRIQDESVVDRWFPERGRTASATIGEARSFRMEDGLVVSLREGILAIGRRSEGDRVLPQATYLMRGRPGTRLEETPSFAQARSLLPANPLATLYVAQDADGSSPPARVGGGQLEKPHFLAALYEADGGLDIAVRGTLDAPSSTKRVSIDTIERFLKLPRSTLFAVARNIDANDWLTNKPGNSSQNSILERYLRSLIGLIDADGSVITTLPELGPDAIFVWDQNFDARSLAPQLGLLIQCADPPGFTTLFSKITRQLIEMLRRFDTVDAVATLELAEAHHLGTSYTCLPLRRYSETTSLPWGRLLASVEPCWAAEDGWVIITLGRDHLKRMLDSQRGMAPALSSIRDMDILRRRRANLNAVAMMHGELTAEVLREWLNHAAKGAEPSLLAPGWWKDLTGSSPASRRSVGIGMRARQEPGTVEVALVHEGSAAHGIIEVGDRILGIDGALLAIDAPNADLRRRLHESRAHPGPTLRVHRDGRALDVVLPLSDSPGTLPRLGVSPVEAVQELASLVRAIPFASFAITSLDDQNFAARLTVRFASETSERIPPE